MAQQTVKNIAIYDTTLRDGSQAEGISFSLQDKLRIAARLDEFGMDYIEGGWPGSNPKDIEFFAAMRGRALGSARLAAFGSTRRPTTTAESDEMLQLLVAADTPVVTIVAKAWDFHVTHVLKVSLQANLDMISDSVAWLAARVPEVMLDAEHFFDGYSKNPRYALQCLLAAQEAGATALVLCDTNGGSLPQHVGVVVKEVCGKVTAQVGIHTHDDSACGVANALAGVSNGATQVQGTVNGYGERCGNANLLAIAANLQLKMGYNCLKPYSLAHLTGLSQFVDEVANLAPNTRQAYVGRSAFAHKAGLHVDSIMKHRSTYEHVDPERVGNTRRMLVSELSGGSTIIAKAARHKLDMVKGSPETRRVLKKVADLERAGYSFEGAEASFELILMQETGIYQAPFEVVSFRVIVEQRGAGEPVTEATVKIKVGDVEQLTVAEGDGPVHALDGALRKALVRFFPEMEEIRLTDFKVRVVNVADGTAAGVRTIIDSADGNDVWSTTGLSTNMIAASWQALVDSVIYGLLRRNLDSAK